MSNPKLSIILPIYNTEQYLDKCLESIINNTFCDYELIVINDGTKDNSENIILKYKKIMGEKLIYVKKENTGLSDTRNVGIKMAKGDYISFIDSDDYIEYNMYEEMFNKLETFDYDVVVCDVNLVYEDSVKKVQVSSGYNVDLMTKEQLKHSMISFYPVVWNKIYKKEIVEEFTKGVWYEDMEFNLKIYPSIKSIGVVKKPLYNYLQRKNSITYTYNDKLYDIIDNMTRVIDYYIAHNIFDEYKDELEYLYARYAFATFLKRLAKCNDNSKYKKGVNYALTSVKKTFPNYKANKYLKIVGFKEKYIKHFNKLFARINFIIQNLSKYN